jgi:hypothetical protein
MAEALRDYRNGRASGRPVRPGTWPQKAAEMFSLDLLAAGGSEAPDVLLGRLGVDVTDPGFWELGLKLLGGMLDQAEELAAQGGDVAEHVDEEDREAARGCRPKPALVACLLPARLIDILHRRRPNRGKRLLMGRRQGRAHLLFEVRDRPQRHRRPEQGLADLFHAALTDAMTAGEVRQRGGQARSNAVGANGAGDGGPRHPAAARAGAGLSLVFGYFGC